MLWNEWMERSSGSGTMDRTGRRTTEGMTVLAWGLQIENEKLSLHSIDCFYTIELKCISDDVHKCKCYM